MKRALRFYLIDLLFCCFYSAGSLAYEVAVHQKISASAFEQVISSRNFLADLGLNPNEKINGEIPENWVIFGSAWEDDIFPPGFPPRSAYHFFDPVNNKGLNGTYRGITYNFEAAPNWAADATNNSLYSIPEARNYMYLAFTSTDPIVRANALATTFRAVGQFTHLLQDMAQPQHVRNDIHLSFSERLDWIFTGWSRYERYTLANKDSLTYAGYPTVTLPNYRSYWIGAGKGLAEFANGNFVSEGTNFNNTSIPGSGSGIYPSPDIGATTDTSVTLATVADIRGNPLPAINVRVRYKGAHYVDQYDSSFSGNNNRLSTYSLFDFIHLSYAGTDVFSLYNTNHQAYADILIPRAVGYSAGLINYFFRGKMQISLPTEGVYSLIDTSTTPGGFSNVKLVLTNASPAGEDMVGGQVVAVAKFHNNNCYVGDLSGEMGLPGNDYNTCRSSDEKVVVSAPLPLTLAAGATAAPLTFDFSSNPIPLSATDLYLQVVYRGQLGQEADAVAVTTLDIAEPTTFDITNMTDYYLLNGIYYYVPFPYNNATVRPGAPGTPLSNTVAPALFDYIDINHNGVYDVGTDRYLARTTLTYSFDFGGGAMLGHMTLPASSFARFAVLANNATVTLNLTKYDYGYIATIPIAPTINRLDPVSGPDYLTPSFFRGRYAYNDSPDYSFYPTLVPIPPGLPALNISAPQPITITFFPPP